MTMYKCWGCDVEFEREEDTFFCGHCKPLRLAGKLDIAINVVSDHDSMERGYAGYNNGLDMYIKDKGHWKQEVRRQGVVPVG